MVDVYFLLKKTRLGLSPVFLCEGIVKINKQSRTILIVTLFYWFAQYVYVPYQTPYLTSIQTSSSFIGLVVGAYGLNQMLLRFPIGVAADKGINHKILITAGPLMAGGSSLIRILVPNGIGYLIANIISGMSSAVWLSFIAAFLYLNRDMTKTKAMGILIMFNNIGMLMGFLGSTFIYPLTNMKFICGLSFVSGIIGTFFALTLKHQNYQSRNKNNSIWQLASVVKNKELLLYSFLALIQQGIQMSTTMSFTNNVIKGIGAPSYCEGAASIIYMIAAVLFAKITTSKYLDLFSKKTWIVVSFILLGVYCLLMPYMTNIWIIFLMQLIPGMGTGILFSLLNSKAIAHVDPNKISGGMGTFQAIYAIGVTFFPIIAGVLKRNYSLAFAFTSLGIISILTGVGYFFLEKNKRRKYNQ